MKAENEICARYNAEDFVRWRWKVAKRIQNCIPVYVAGHGRLSFPGHCIRGCHAFTGTCARTRDTHERCDLWRFVAVRPGRTAHQELCSSDDSDAQLHDSGTAPVLWSDHAAALPENRKGITISDLFSDG